MPRTRDEFSTEARIYDRIWGTHDYDSDVKFLADLLKKHRCTSIVDVGCGTGNHALRLSRLGYEVVGIDISPAMLKVAKSKDKGSRTRFIQGEMKALRDVIPESEIFDAAISLGQVTSHLHTDLDVEAFLRGMHAILKKGGLLVLSATNAAKISEECLNRLLLDHLVNERKIQIAVLAQNNRDSKDPNTIIWRPLYLIKQNGKVDFRIREHRLRWFQFSALKKLLMKNYFDIDAVLSGPSRERFEEQKHIEMWFVATAR